MNAYLKSTLLLCLASLAGCADVQTTVYQEGVVTENGEPAYITIQHCLIGFRDVLPDRSLRSQDDAVKLANEIFEKAKAGEDFDAIVRKHSDDGAPGIYKLANHGYESDRGGRVPSRVIHARGGMVPAFGDVGFALEVGEVGLAEYDPQASQYGFHIIKRLK
ncbi:MAG: hypothetical protein Aurels2KO_12950 [Aureliella sp.]